MNPFFCDDETPRFAEMTPDAASEALRKLLAVAEKALGVLETDPKPGWTEFVQPLYESCRPLEESWGLVNHLHSVVNSDAWRKVIEDFQPELVRFSLRVAQNRKFFRAYSETLPLDGVQKRILERILSEARLAGVDLEGEARSRFNELSEEIAELATQFTNQLLDAVKVGTQRFELDADLDGIPEGLARSLKQPDGSYAVPLSGAVYVPFMKNCKNRASRERMYRAYATRAGETNAPVIEKLLKAKRELAVLLSYKSYADVSLSRKSARAVPVAEGLLNRLFEAGRPAAEREVVELEAFAGGSLEPWDLAFWSERLMEAKYAYDEESLKQYFPFEQVLEGLFDLTYRLFGVSVKELSGTVQVWHKDVRYFVLEENGTQVASFYLDPYVRPASKNGGAWMNSFRTRDASGRRPVAVLVCNQAVSAENEPDLMRFDEVTTLFHEFGHALQHMLTDVTEPMASGINGIEWDAVEVASQFMENFCYSRGAMRRLSRHIVSGETIPDELFEKIHRARNFMAGNALMRQLYFSLTDLELYARYPENGAVSADEVKRRIAAKVLLRPVPEYDRFLCSFGHIFGGGYAAGYYSYKWSEVMAADLFGFFQGIDSDAKLRELGLKLRRTLLGQGGGTAPDEVFRAFADRDPQVESLLRQCGLI